MKAIGRSYKGELLGVGIPVNLELYRALGGMKECAPTDDYGDFFELVAIEPGFLILMAIRSQPRSKYYRFYYRQAVSNRRILAALPLLVMAAYEKACDERAGSFSHWE